MFLDRDGVINKEIHLLHTVDQLDLIPGAGEAIFRLNQSNDKVIVVTNQSVVARGIIDEEGVERIHEHLKDKLRKTNAYLDDIYFCPHHPEADLPSYRKDCSKRKPNVGMLQQAKREHSLDLGSSYLIGDSTSDIKAGNDAGCSTILVETGYAGEDGKYDMDPDYKCDSIVSAVDLILEPGDK